MGQKEETNYERLRTLRMAENKARMEALGLSKMADTLMGSRRKMTQKRVVVNDKFDVDYEPDSDDDTCNDSSGSSEKEIEAMDSRNDELRDKDERTDCREDEGPHEDQPSTSQPKKRKTVGRGPSKPVQSSKPMFLEFDEYELPTGEFEDKYSKHIGQCAYRIDINIRKWNKVDQVQKDTLWAETKKLFHIEDPTGKRKKNFERAVGARFRAHKSDLVRRFIEKSKAPTKGNPNADKEPWDLYEGYITKEQWEKFEEYTQSSEFKKKSEIGKLCSKGNIHRHTLGQKSYNRKRKDWVKEDRLPPSAVDSSTEESSIVTKKLQNRALEWCLAHQRRTKDGKWEVDPSKGETVRVVNQVMEHLEKESNEKESGVASASASEVENDALCKALEKKDYYGYVKGIGRSGVGIGHRQAFGKEPRKGMKDRVNRDEEMDALKATIARLEMKIEAIASLSSINLAGNNKEVTSKPPLLLNWKTPKEAGPQKCRLAMTDDDGNLVVVAEGTWYPSETSVLHTSSMLPDHYKVSIDHPYEEYHYKELPVPSPDGETNLGKAKDYFVCWPKSMVLFEDAMTASQSKEGVGSCDPLRTQDPNSQMGALSDLPECELVYMLMTEDEHESVCVSFKAPTLYLQEDQHIYITPTDVDELVRGVCINVSVIHVYICYLLTEFISKFEGGHITFLCPQRFSGAECQRSFFDVVKYVKHAFNSELKRKDSKSHLILAPYNESNHWILMAIDLCDGIIYQLDPLTQQAPRTLSCENVFDLAYKSYRARIKENTKMVLEVKRIECAQQTDGLDCGYYVMKYMNEIVKKVGESKGDVKQIRDYIRRSAPYTKGELDEVREQWARFFRLNYFLCDPN